MFDIQEELKKLPEKPGVYIMKDEYDKIIYVGKAVILKNRVRQYFQASANHTPKVRAMVARIKEFEYIVTDSELEALILECNLIKKHKPKFNILLKDDKNYPYIKITMNEEYPRILMTRKAEKDGAKYFGPYSSANAVRETIDLLKKLFPIKSCRKVLPRDAGKERPCLNYYIYQCLGPCQGNINKEQYRALMKDIAGFLGGRQEEIIRKLENQMEAAAQAMDFEKAAGLRDKITSLRHIAEKQKVLSTAREDQDVIAFAKDGPDSCIQAFFIRSGKLIGREHFIFNDVGEADNRELMTSFVKQFYGSAAFIPGEIILQEEIDELELIEHWLRDKRSARVHIRVPRKGEKHHLVEMVSENALLALKQFKERIKTDDRMSSEGLQELSLLLNLDMPACSRIEAYDISNTGTSDMVASMIVFEDGLAANREYRRFKIKSIIGQDDYGSMQEAIFRRFKHAEREKLEIAERGSTGNKEEGKFTRLPDLILADGGLGHVNAVSSVLKDLGLAIPVWGMVKDDRHRTRGLVAKTGEIDLSKHPAAFRLVTAIQDEAHRFALDYNKRLRKKRMTGSALDEIGGIGEKRRKALIRHFGSINAIKAAGVDDLLAVDSMNKIAAQKVYDYFHN